MDSQTHWENIYSIKTPDAVSWYRPHLEQSLELIRRAAPELSASIIDVGGGESTLVDDLIGQGYENITVLDISRIAIEATRSLEMLKYRFHSKPLRLLGRIDMLENTGFPLDQAYDFDVDLKRDQLETRVATLDLKLVTARARPEPHEDEIVKLEQELKVATAVLEKYNRERPHETD